MSDQTVPSILDYGLKFLSFIKQPYSIIPLNEKKMPMCKVKGHPENLIRLLSKDYDHKLWSKATYYGVVVSPAFNPDTTKQLIVIDLDVPSEDGHESDGREYIGNFNIPDTLEVRTKSGGTHFYLWIDKGIKLNSRPYPGIDIVMVSPFFMVGPLPGVYDISKKRAIAIADQELVDQLTKVNNKSDDEQSNMLLDNIQAGIPKGERHDTILKLMGRCAALHIPKGESMLLAQYAIGKCDQSTGLPNIEDIEKQYDDAVSKFQPRTSLDDLMRDLVLVTSTGRIANIDKPTVTLSKDTLVAEHPGLIPNVNKPLNAQGMHPLAKTGSVWLDSTEKHVVDKMGYYPSDEKIFTYESLLHLNEYSRGPVYLPEKYSKRDAMLVQDVLSRTYGPIYEDYLKSVYFKWMNPEVKFNWAIFLTSRYEGTGKGLSFKMIQNMFGPRNCVDMKPESFGERFNSTWTHSLFTLIDEANMTTSRNQRVQLMNSLKRIITEDSMTVEVKGMEKEAAVRAFFLMFIFSNEKSTLDINKDSRRFLVHHDEEIVTPQEAKRMYELGSILSDYKHNKEFVGGILRWMRETVDISISDTFNPKGIAKKTKSLRNEDHLLSIRGQAILDAIEAEEHIFISDIITLDLFRYYCKDVLELSATDTMYLKKELVERKLLRFVPRNPKVLVSTKNTRTTLVPTPDMPMARNGLPLHKVLSKNRGIKNIYCIRNPTKWIHTKASPKDLKNEINKLYTDQSRSNLAVVDA